MELLDVDYNLPVEEVYTNAAWAFIKKNKNLDILGHCYLRSESEASPSSLKLPSWVPDWTARSTPVYFFKRGASSRSSPDSAGDGFDIMDALEVGN
jgi:hypothetical protein